MRRQTIFFIIALLLAANPLSAATPEERIANLERQISSLQKTYASNNAETASAVSRIGAFHDEFNSIKGQMEAVSHQMKSQRDESMRLIVDLQNRVQAIEDRMAIFSAELTSALEKVAPAVAAEADLYQKGLSLADSSKYLEAASVFESFIQKYPKSQFVPGARFWVGNCFFSIRDYKRAIKEYQDFVEKHPRDPKVPEAILKQGSSFYELGMLDEARPFYEKVISSYPGSQAAAQAKAKLSRVDERKAGGAAGPETGGASSYPGETIEQQRQKMSSPKPAEQAPAKAKPEARKRDASNDF